jgi:hypothetical protein
MCTLYNYFKIINIAIIFFPAMAQPSSSYFALQLNWNNSDNSNIQQEDNSKMIPVYRTRKYFFKFVPLNMPLLLGTNNSPVVVNLMNYMRTSDNIVVPGCFNFDSEQDFTSRVRIVMRIEYRGSKVPDSTGLTKLLDVVRNTEQLRPKIERKEIKNNNIREDEPKEDEKEEEESDSEYEGDSEFIESLKSEE